MGKKLFFSLQGVDINDDEALEAFVDRVWQEATGEFTDHEAVAADNHETQSSTEGKDE